MNMVSYGAVKSALLGNSTNYSGYSWDIVGPSYLSGLSQWKTAGKITQGYIVVDFYLGHRLEATSISPFLEKLAAISVQKNISNPLPILVHDGMDEECFKLAKSKGIMLAQSDVIFGKEIGRLLRDIRSILVDTSSSLKNNPEHALQVFKRVSRIEGSAFNLKGALFEFIIGYLYNLNGYTDVKLRKMIKFDNSLVESDIVALSSSEVIFCECKGLLAGNEVTIEQIDYWVNEQIPTMKKWVRHANTFGHYQGDLIFRFYFSGYFSKEVWEYCRAVSSKYVKFKVEFYDFRHIGSEIKRLNASGIIDVYREQFLPKK